MMHDKNNTDSNSHDASAARMISPVMTGWDHAAMTKAVWALADCPVLRLFSDPMADDHRVLH
ncbi:hypothetical protein M2360_000765 [Rhizobium sp. SG_E_25_P2]|uniref:hypothetical protein n=1 Tax=Rhizobium sp. SG_E_25_P2 TaxID=2879942 RepID=UPI00247641ED|nr:hypothetical protein [Rhizobium sp. SG_E_25_P2]MDH6265384.1 hypothetical protein [Rhizobium sp. SG_E_25_P2]